VNGRGGRWQRGAKVERMGKGSEVESGVMCSCRRRGGGGGVKMSGKVKGWKRGKLKSFKLDPTIIQKLW